MLIFSIFIQESISVFGVVGKYLFIAMLYASREKVVLLRIILALSCKGVIGKQFLGTIRIIEYQLCYFAVMTELSLSGSPYLYLNIPSFIADSHLLLAKIEVIGIIPYEVSR